MGWAEILVPLCSCPTSNRHRVRRWEQRADSKHVIDFFRRERASRRGKGADVSSGTFAERRSLPSVSLFSSFLATMCFICGYRRLRPLCCCCGHTKKGIIALGSRRGFSAKINGCGRAANRQTNRPLPPPSWTMEWKRWEKMMMMNAALETPDQHISQLPRPHNRSRNITPLGLSLIASMSSIVMTDSRAQHI